MSVALTEEDRFTLLKAARSILEEGLKLPQPASQSAWVKSALESFTISDNSPRAVFVTLKQAGSLRGCLGSIEPEFPLLEAVAITALKSAFEDPRFPPLSPEELPETEIEISLLSQMEKIVSPEKIVPKLHGVFVKKGFRSGLFLPQVWEQLPKKEEFLSELCFGKAGLKADAWKDPETQIFVFTVEHFSESEFK